MLTGALSFGSFHESEGYPAIPSPRQPQPGEHLPWKHTQWKGRFVRHYRRLLQWRLHNSCLWIERRRHSGRHSDGIAGWAQDWSEIWYNWLATINQRFLSGRSGSERGFRQSPGKGNFAILLHLLLAVLSYAILIRNSPMARDKLAEKLPVFLSTPPRQLRFDKFPKQTNFLSLNNDKSAKIAWRRRRFEMFQENESFSRDSHDVRGVPLAKEGPPFRQIVMRNFRAIEVFGHFWWWLLEV